MSEGKFSISGFVCGKVVLNFNDPVTFTYCAWAPQDQIDVRLNNIYTDTIMTLTPLDLASLAITRAAVVCMV